MDARGGGITSTRTFEEAEVDSLSGEVRDHVGRVAALVGSGKEGQAAVDHLQGEGRKGLVEFLGHGVGEADQDGVEQPGGSEREVDAIGGADPDVGQTEQAFDSVVAVLNGMIAHDKFCVSREATLSLSWWRRPLHLRHYQETRAGRPAPASAVLCNSLGAFHPCWGHPHPPTPSPCARERGRRHSNSNETHPNILAERRRGK